MADYPSIPLFLWRIKVTSTVHDLRETVSLIGSDKVEGTAVRANDQRVYGYYKTPLWY